MDTVVADQDEFYRLVDFIPIPMMIAEYVTDESTGISTYIMRYFNQAFQKVIGYTPEQIPDMDAWFQAAYPDETYRQEVWESWFNLIRSAVKEQASSAKMAVQIQCANGDQRWFELTSDVNYAIKPRHSIVMFVDIEQHKQTEARLERLALTDELTQLPNRRRMLEALEGEIQRSRTNNRPYVLVLADIDDFKYVNDSYGHECGDLLLQHVGNTLRSQLRSTDMVARWGGEEFCILLTDTDLQGAKAVVERMQTALKKQPLNYEHVQIVPTLTYGLTLYDLQDSVDQTLRKADTALYHGKNHGKNTIIVYAEHMYCLVPKLNQTSAY